MGHQEIMEMFEDCPVIAAIKDEEGLQKCLNMDIQAVFVLYGDICTIGGIVERLKQAQKMVFVHLDLIDGLGSKEVAVNYIKNTTKADGIISTKPALIKRAKELDYMAIMRFFLIDSLALKNMEKQIMSAHPDMIEIIPGAMPKIIRKICENGKYHVPIIAGGLIADKKDVLLTLDAGALAVSTTDQHIWEL